MQYKFTNTTASHKAAGLTWDKYNPFKSGNTIYPTYNAGESSRVPLKGVIYVNGYEFPFMAANSSDSDLGLIMILINAANHGARPDWIMTWGRDLKTALEDVERTMSDIETAPSIAKRTVFVERDNQLIETRIASVPRIFTWDSFDEFVVSEGENITLEGSLCSGTFIRTVDGRYFARQNNDWWIETREIENIGNETMVSTPEFLHRHKKVSALFAETEHGWYEYECGYDTYFPIQEAREAINRKIAADIAELTTLDETYAALEGMRLTIQDSLVVGNCPTGTNRFIEDHRLQLIDGEFIVDSTNKDYVWNLALENQQFMRVLKNKVIKS